MSLKVLSAQIQPLMGLFWPGTATNPTEATMGVSEAAGTHLKSAAELSIFAHIGLFLQVCKTPRVTRSRMTAPRF